MELQFSEVEIGVRIFDPLSGEYYIKVGENDAETLGGMRDYFESTDIVEVD